MTADTIYARWLELARIGHTSVGFALRAAGHLPSEYMTWDAEKRAAVLLECKADPFAVVPGSSPPAFPGAIEDSRARALRQTISDAMRDTGRSTDEHAELIDRLIEVLHGEGGMNAEEAQSTYKRMCDAQLLVNRMVLQEWVVETCTWKQQTVLLAALRGPDSGASAEIKSWVRWIRRSVLKNAAPNKTFMQTEVLVSFRDLANKSEDPRRSPLVLDMLSVHFLSHIMHALQIIGLHGPDGIHEQAHLAYNDICDYLHLQPEHVANMRARLRDET